MSGLRLLAAAVVVGLSACATSYQPLSFSGGFRSKQIEGQVYRVTFSANGYSTAETAQTYWLYRCSELALEKQFEGFEILSNINLVMPLAPEQFFAPQPGVRKVQYVYTPIIIDSGYKPFIEADIQLLKGPITAAPPRVFDAAKLQALLDPYVKGEKCNAGNVCEHVHKYLFPDGKFDSQNR